jgi:hypothetical protein
MLSKLSSSDRPPANRSGERLVGGVHFLSTETFMKCY